MESSVLSVEYIDGSGSLGAAKPKPALAGSVPGAGSLDAKPNDFCCSAGSAPAAKPNPSVAGAGAAAASVNPNPPPSLEPL